MTELGLTQILIAGAFIAAAGGLLGSFALLRRMALVGDALSHVALPGLGVALLLKINPIIGGAAALLLGVLIIWVIETKSNISTETVIGVIPTKAVKNYKETFVYLSGLLAK